MQLVMRLGGLHCVLRGALWLATAGIWFTAHAQPMLSYDPDDKVNATGARAATNSPESAVRITLDRTQRLTTIGPQFYGLNIHPGTAKLELPNKEILKLLKPDAIRIMTNQRIDWSLEGKGRKVHELSIKAGVFDWGPLDALVEGTLEVGAVPYLALGFGPPEWLKPQRSSKRMPPVHANLDAYAEFMAQIAERYHKRVGNRPFRISVENEPENVGYLLEDYVDLFNKAYKRIKAVDASIQVGGPSIGYAMWPQQPGRSLSFGQSVVLLKARIQPDFFDWHIYSYTSKNILKTVSIVKGVYGADKPMVISELNRDWRYSGPELAKSVKANTGWESVGWFADAYDKLQREGLEQLFYFAWRSDALGLVDNRLKVVRPNFFIFWALTNIMGRQRVLCDTGAQELGCIATSDNGVVRSLVYNTGDANAVVTFNQLPKAEIARFDRAWYERNKAIGVTLAVPRESKSVSLLVPTGGFVVYEHDELPRVSRKLQQ